MSGPRSIWPRASRLAPRSRGGGRRYLHETGAQPANPLPIVATGPPPAPPRPSVSDSGERVERRRRQAELLKLAREKPAKKAGADNRPLDVLRQRFWKDVSVQRTPEGLHMVHLDTRAVRSPHTKSPLLLPASKPHLATAIALEWDVLTSAQQALKNHLIPLTSLAARAHGLAEQDAADSAAGKELGSGHGGNIRQEIVRQMLRYLDTDTLLCWAPATSGAAAEGGSDQVAQVAAAAAALVSEGSGVGGSVPARVAATTSAAAAMFDGRALEQSETLRERQERTAAPIVRYLTTHVWPGVQLEPALSADSIMPAAQPAATREVVRGWLAGLGAWELAGLERAALASKSVCVAARLVAEWSENLRLPSGDEVEGLQRFGVDEAEEACTVEVRWQTGQWGEVEDTHDVEREDLRRQLGSAVLLVSGTQHTD